MDEDHRIYKLIEAERRERIESIASIHNRLDDILSEISKVAGTKKNGTDSNASWVRQSVGLTIAVIALVGFMVPTVVAVVKPMQQQIDYIMTTLDRHMTAPAHPGALERHAHSSERFKEVETQFEALEDISAKAEERHNARISKLEEWQRWWYRSIPDKDAKQDSQLEHIESELNRVNELFRIRRANIRELAQ